MAKATDIPISFPTRGLVESMGYTTQPEQTTVDCLNVRPFDPLTGRLRGAQRPGISKYTSGQFTGGNRIQCISHVATSRETAQSQSTISLRTVTRVAVSNGTIATFNGTSFTTVTGGSSALNTNAPFIFAAPLYGKLYFADGTNAIVYDVATNTASTWTTTAGSLPANGSYRPRLIELWRGRLVLAGIAGDENNWYMSAKDAPANFDYNPDPDTVTKAVAGNNSDAGLVEDIITAMIPYSDDVLIFGGDQSIWLMSGDPADGGRLDKLSDVTGMAWGRAWCKGPAGEVYFIGRRGGFYRLVPGESLQRMSESRIDERLATIDMDTHAIRLAWNDREIGVYVFITDLGGGASTHYFWDKRTDSFWPMSFKTANHNPTAVHVLDGDDANDRTLLLGCQDGYMRQMDVAALDDDSREILSYVKIGPLVMGDKSFLISKMDVTLGENSGDVVMTLHVGDTAELANAHAGTSRRRLNAGWNPYRPRVRANAAYIKLEKESPDDGWNMERMSAHLIAYGESEVR